MPKFKSKKKDKINHPIVKAIDRTWDAFLAFGPVDDGRPEGDEFDAALTDLRHHRHEFAHSDNLFKDALIGIINASNANPEPIHYNVRAAIQAAREILSQLESEDE